MGFLREGPSRRLRRAEGGSGGAPLLPGGRPSRQSYPGAVGPPGPSTGECRTDAGDGPPLRLLSRPAGRWASLLVWSLFLARAASLPAPSDPPRSLLSPSAPPPSPTPGSSSPVAPSADPPPLPWEDEPCGGDSPLEGAPPRGRLTGGAMAPWLTLDVTHGLFEADTLVPGLVYKVSAEWSSEVEMRRLVVTSLVDAVPHGLFAGTPTPSLRLCDGAAVVWADELSGRKSYALNWSLPAAGSEVILRVSYLPVGPLQPITTETATATSDLSIGVVTLSFRLLSACQLALSHQWGALSWKDIEHASAAFGGGDCTVHFPPSLLPSPPPSASTPAELREPMGLLVDLTRLNVACSQGHLQFGPSSRRVFCGKLEEYRPSERQVHLRGGRAYLRLVVVATSGAGERRPGLSPEPPPPRVSFSMRYHPVEPCFNLTLTESNGSLSIPPPPPSFPSLPPPFRPRFERVRCTLTLHLPYGYRVRVRLRLAGAAATPVTGASVEAGGRWGVAGGEGACARGVLVGAWEDAPRWTKCVAPGAVTEESSQGNRLVLRVYWGGAEEVNELPSTPPHLLLEFAAVGVEAIVGGCGFGWASLERRGPVGGGGWPLDRRKRRRVEAGAGRRWTCVGAMEGQPLPWGAAEAECARLGGHLASVRSEEEQALLDLLLTRSPGYSEHNSYWVGASDVVREGDFRWTDGAEFSFSNWFPGWAAHGHYNRQPNDDGLSGQDCVELRRAYHLPSAPSVHRLAKTAAPRPWPPTATAHREPPPPHRLSATYAWNDRDCSAANYYVCEREAIEGEGVTAPAEAGSAAVEAGGSGGGRAPGGPARGGRVECNREVRLVDPREGGASPEGGDGGAREEGGGEGASAGVLLPGAGISSAVVTSPNFPAPYPDDVRCETVVTAPPGYRLLLEFEELVLEDEPTCSYDYLEISDGPKGKEGGGPLHPGEGGPPAGEAEEQGGGVRPGRRLCGDWSSRLKLLRHVTSGSSLTLRFVSDYSHRFGGFRARVSTLSAASIECVDQRLQPFNNSCYLFVGYPEVTWTTAQQICREMKAELASVLSASEYRFVTSSIRGSDQYSNSAIYWLGGRMSDQRSADGGVVKEEVVGVEAGAAEGAGEEAPDPGWQWVDGSPMDFQAWLPDGRGSEGRRAPLCLGVRWRQSPSPRLHPSGLHWSPEACSSVGGYVCKRRKGWSGVDAEEAPTRAQGGGPGSTGGAGRSTEMIDLKANAYPASFPPALVPTSRGGDQESWSPPLVMKDLVLEGDSGVVTSPGYPERYPPEVRARIIIVCPLKNRLFIRFTTLDLEDQPDCLYDYVEVREVTKSAGPGRAERWCGSHTTDLERFDFVSDTNSAEVFFRSDYSVSGAGFSAVWHAVDVSGCPSQTLTASQGTAGEANGVLTSPNHPMALIPRLDCTTTLLAPAGRHVWLEFSEGEVLEGGGVELWLGAAGRRPFRPFATPTAGDQGGQEEGPAEPAWALNQPPPLTLRHLGGGVFLSDGDRLMVRLWTGDKPRGKGFKATFRAVDGGNSDEHVIVLGNNTRGPLLHLNYPDEPPAGVRFAQRLLAPHGHVVRIRLVDVAVASSEDGAVAANASAPPLAVEGSCRQPPHLEVRDRYSGRGGGSTWVLCPSPGSVLSLTSYLNSITVVQRAEVGATLRLNAIVRVEADPNYKMKLLHCSKYGPKSKENGDENELSSSALGERKIPSVESCHPNPCLHGGKCVGGPGMHGRRTCQCKGYYTGLFCALTVCDLEPCVFGLCVLSGDAETGGPGFTCSCYPGYTGVTCDERPRPCADNPCEGRGDCLEKGPHSFVCRCHAWWEGQKCERRMLRIPYKPLSERMLHEPFWLGLITVTVVLGIIGLIWCAKRHFPEKLEKLLAEEADRTRHGVTASSSARDNLQSLGGAQGYGIAVEGSHHHQAHPGGQQPPRSLFGRLGIRKPSLLSLTGGSGTSAQMQRPQLAQPAQSPPCPNTPAIPDRKPNAPMIPHRQASSSQLLGGAGSQQQSSSSSSAARTSSLDDLLKLPPRRKALSVTQNTCPPCSLYSSLYLSHLCPSFSGFKAGCTLFFGYTLHLHRLQLSSPSSRKKRNNSSPTRKHSATPLGAAAAAAAAMAEAEKKKILQSLVSSAPKAPVATGARLSISLPPSESLSLGECPPNSQANLANTSETKFMGERGGEACLGDDIVLDEPLPGPPLMPPVPPTASRLDKKVTFARLLSRVSAEMGSSSASGSGSEATPASKPVPETVPPIQDSPCPQHPSSPASDESSSVSSSPSSSSLQASTTGAAPAAAKKSSRSKIQVTVVDALLGNKEGISSTRGPSIFLEPPSSSMGTADHPPLSPIHEIPSPSPTKRGLLPLGKGSSSVPTTGTGGQAHGGREGDEEGEEEEEEEEEEPARVCITEEGETEEGDREEEEGGGKAGEEQRALSIDAACLEATDDDVGDEGLEEDSPEGVDTMSEETHSSGNCSLPKSAKPQSSLSPTPPLVIPTITVQQPSPTRTTMANRPLMMLPIGSPPPRRRLSEHHSYPPPIFFQPPLSPQVSQPGNKRLLLHGPDKPTSLDLPICPPVITITATMSESDEMDDGCVDNNGGRCNTSSYRSSGTNTLGPSGRRLGDDGTKCSGQSGMTYLSPFSMCSRGERTASESNLSSSGYSSMASPGPSRAGSNNPLCPSDATDAEDPHQHPSGNHPHHGPHLLLPHHRTGHFLHPHVNAGAGSTGAIPPHPSIQSHHQHYLNLPLSGVGGNGQSSPTCSDHDGSGMPHLPVPSCHSWTRRPSPLLQAPNVEDAGVVERPPGSPPLPKSLSVSLRKPQNSGGSSCEAVEEFGRSSGGEEEGRVERHNSSTTPDSNDEGIGTEGETGKSTSTMQKTLQLPSIVVAVRGASPPPVEAEPGPASKLSPVSSRSESPLSDRVSLPSSSPFGHNSSPRPFSALFFGKGPPLPLTDSDALYDCPSSEVLGGDDSSTGGHATHSKDLSFGIGLQSTHSITSTSKASNLLEVPHRQGGMQRKVSPKRRVRAPIPVCSSSSSSSSLEGIHSKRHSTSTSYVQQSSKCSSSSDRTASKSIEVPYSANLQSPHKLHHYQPRKYKHLRGWISPGAMEAMDQKKCFEVTLSSHGLSSVPHSSNPSSSSTATTPLPNDDVGVTADTAPEIIGKESKWIYGPEKIGLREAYLLPLDGQESLPQTRKICRMKTIGHQIRFLRRLELTLKKRERLASPSDSDDGPQRMDEEDDCDRKEDSSQSSSEATKVPLLPMTQARNLKEGRYRSSLRRQRRSYDRAGRIGSKSTAPVLEPLLHQMHVSSSSEDEGEKSICRTSPFRQKHTNLPTTLPSSATLSVTTAPNINR
ncbi:uncharacterized protein [Hetaerina americana]|uniref:uncharacterized protein n=1 Tax=Hetaerina americana TaxID=62018 RepID=UPI003A7F5AC2